MIQVQLILMILMNQKVHLFIFLHMKSYNFLLVTLTVKCYYNDDIRSFDIENLNFDVLKKKVEEEYNQQFIIKYKVKSIQIFVMNEIIVFVLTGY